MVWKPCSLLYIISKAPVTLRKKPNRGKAVIYSATEGQVGGGPVGETANFDISVIEDEPDRRQNGYSEIQAENLLGRVNVHGQYVEQVEEARTSQSDEESANASPVVEQKPRQRPRGFWNDERQNMIRLILADTGGMVYDENGVIGKPERGWAQRAMDRWLEQYPELGPLTKRSVQHQRDQAIQLLRRHPEIMIEQWRIDHPDRNEALIVQDEVPAEEQIQEPLGAQGEATGSTDSPEPIQREIGSGRGPNGNVNRSSGDDEKEDPYKRQEVVALVESLRPLVTSKFHEFTDFENRVSLPKKFYYTENQLYAMDLLVDWLFNTCDDKCPHECRGSCQTHIKLNTSVYVAAFAVTREFVAKSRDKYKEKLLRQQKERERRDRIRREIAWLDLFIHGKLGSSAKHNRIRRRMRGAFKGDLRKASEKRNFLQNKLKVVVTQIRDNKEAEQSRDQNLNFVRNGQVTLEKETSPKQVPTADQIEEFWSNIVGQPGKANTDHCDLVDWREKLSQKIVTDGLERANVEEVELTDTIWDLVMRKLKNWKAPGRDKIAGFLWKHLKLAQSKLRALVELTINDFDLVEELVDGRTVLLLKSKGKEHLPEGYRPITILCVQYKIVTGCIARIIEARAIELNALGPNQRCAKRNTWGALDCLLADQCIEKYVMRERLDLAVAWFDYMKAFDSVPHEYIDWLVDALQLPAGIANFVKRVKRLWRTTFYLYHESDTCDSPLSTKKILYVKGAFQGDLLSLILFILGMGPISHGLSKLPKLRVPHLGNVIVNHLFFCDDLKVYANDEQERSILIGKVAELSEATGQTLGLDKCNYNLIKKGKIIQGQETDHGIAPLGGGKFYKYLGCNQLAGHGDAVESNAARLEEKIADGITGVLKSGLAARYCTQAVNQRYLDGLRYHFTARVFKRNKTQKILERGVHNLCRRVGYMEMGDSTSRLHISRKLGGRGIRSLLEVFDATTVSLVAYILTCDDPLVTAIRMVLTDSEGKGEATVLREGRNVLAKLQGDPKLPELEAVTITIGDQWDMSHVRNGKVVSTNFHNRKDLNEAVREYYDSMFKCRLEVTKMHGKYFKYANELGPHCWSWLNSNVSVNTERLISAAQNGALTTNYYRAKIRRNAVSDKCRKCKQWPETVGHILNFCTGSSYNGIKDRHDRAFSILFDECLKEFGFTTRESPRIKYGQIARERKSSLWKKDGFEFWWDTLWPTIKFIDDKSQGRRPDAVFIYKAEKKIIIADMNCYFYETKQDGLQCYDIAVNRKIEAYRCLKDDLYRKYRDYSVSVVPVCMGSLGEYDSEHVLGAIKSILRLDDDVESQKRAVRIAERMQLEIVSCSAGIISRHFAPQ